MPSWAHDPGAWLVGWSVSPVLKQTCSFPVLILIENRKNRSICLSCSVCTVVDATFFCLELGGFTTVGRLLKVPLFLPPATINYLNSSREPPLSMLLYFLLLLYDLLVHYHAALVISIRLQALLCYPICILDIFWWQWSIFMVVLMSSHLCLSLISWGRAYRKMNYTTQRTGWMFCSQCKANLPGQDLAGASK